MTNQFQGDINRDDQLILVDENDVQVGTASKQAVHSEGLLHRAFSVVLYRTCETGIDILLTQRAKTKYHSGGLWTNACCSHPRDGEELPFATVRRVKEELGIVIDPPEEIGAFIYRAEFDNGLIEHEYDHIFVGMYDGSYSPDPEEVDCIRWIQAEDLKNELATRANEYTAWAPRVLTTALDWLDNNAQPS